jgi:hypothetical protein
MRLLEINARHYSIIAMISVSMVAEYIFLEDTHGGADLSFQRMRASSWLPKFLIVNKKRYRNEKKKRLSSNRPIASWGE